MTKDEIDKLEAEITSLRTEYAIKHDELMSTRASDTRNIRQLKNQLYDLKVCITERVKKLHKEEKRWKDSTITKLDENTSKQVDSAQEQSTL